MAAARNHRSENDSEWSVYDGFTFHLLRHTAGSIMAVAGMEPAVAAERMGHTDGGALFLRTYRHLYEGEKRIHAERLQAHVLASLDEEGTTHTGTGEKRLNEAADSSGRTWDRISLFAGLSKSLLDGVERSRVTCDLNGRSETSFQSEI